MFLAGRRENPRPAAAGCQARASIDARLVPARFV
jgi:hypothetical protein